MNIRESIEQMEEKNFSPYASLSSKTRGRAVWEELCDIRPEYQRDRDRILHCKAFRRLKHKTQVFLAPEGDHYRTRLTHTLEVAQIARTVAKALALNESLTEAIALGHDLGHTPFGHAGENILNQVCPFGFTHYEQSVRVVERLEKGGEGLNLTWEVIDGIRNHRTSGNPSTPEGHIVRLSDKIAYINHDIDDAIRARLFAESDLPGELTDILGHTVRERLNTMVHDMIAGSMGKPEIKMTPHVEEAMMSLRAWMFDNVYYSDIPKAEEGKAQRMIVALYEYFNDHPDKLTGEYLRMYQTGEESKERVVCDYIAGMSDRYCIDQYVDLFVPKGWSQVD
ncbi:MAG: deoxyguanosinetriphosphate triphosphohydrolase [Lachnospiraceae bacterium]|jgi:dGTPase|nr:deoxyguanosinetriphosphate triphosphohydrolase [Lachnospiraceae bacterium]